MIALGTRQLAEAVIASGARTAFKDRGFNLDRIDRAAGCANFAAMLTGREVTGMTYGLNLAAEEAATLAYGGERTSREGKPTHESLDRLLAMPEGWWATPSVSVAGLLDEDTTPADLASLLGTGDISETLPASGEARLCALSGQKISTVWGLGGETPIHDLSWISALDLAHQNLAHLYVPTITPEDEQDLYHVTHLPAMPVARAIEVVGAGVGIVVSRGNGRWAQISVRAKKGGELVLRVNGLKADWREDRYIDGLDGVRAIGKSLEALAEDFNQRNPTWATWRAVALRMPSGLLARDRQQGMVA